MGVLHDVWFLALLALLLLVGLPSAVEAQDQQEEWERMARSVTIYRSDTYDWLKPVDGSDPGTEWQGYHALDELPQLLNPESGFVQNCKSTPFLTTTEEHPRPEDYPAYMFARERDTPRARMSRRLLSAEDSFTFESWGRAAFNTHVIEAETFIPKLVDEWEDLAKAEPDRAGRLGGAVEELRAWDFVSTTESKAMTLYIYNHLEMPRDQGPWRRARALESAVARLERDWGTWEAPWGEVNRLQRRHTGGKEPFDDEAPSLAVAGAPGWAGAVFNFNARFEKGQVRRYGVSGHSYVGVVEFCPEVRAGSVHAFGQSADPSSPHCFDQAHLYARGRFKPSWIRLEEVKTHAERVYHPGESGR